MTDLIPCNDCDSPELQQKKGDDFLITFEAYSETGESLPSGLDLSWIISNNSGQITEITDDDVTIEGNYLQFHKDKAVFSQLPLIGSYTHKLYEKNTNTTLIEGKFQLL